MNAKQPIIAANWKMNGRRGSVAEFIPDLVQRCAEQSVSIGREVRVVLCPPAPLLEEAEESLRTSAVELGAQHAGPAESGAFTGELSPQLLADFGVRWVLVGHSERRHVFGETDALVQRRLEAVLAAGLSPMLCVGETLEERKAGQTATVLGLQLSILEGIDKKFFQTGAVAYEPVWAIGTGETASEAQVAESHATIHALLRRLGGTVPLLYGGSVKPQNAASLANVAGVDGLLVGGASLVASEFAKIVLGCAKKG